MSGSTGAPRIRSRDQLRKFAEEYYTETLRTYPGFLASYLTGSFISDKEKTNFGDIDTILLIAGENKPDVKRDLIEHLLKFENIVPFTSEKYAGRRYLNTGEIVTVRYYNKELGYSCQIDNIIALSIEEVEFKRKFLNLPAEIQGLLIGLVKVINHKEEGGWTTDHTLTSSGVRVRRVRYDENFDPIECVELGLRQDWGQDVLEPIKHIRMNSFLNMLSDINKYVTDSRSRARIVGMFKSMVTVKSGEVDTPKGERKRYAINLVENTLC